MGGNSCTSLWLVAKTYGFCYLNLSALEPEEPTAGPKGPQRARRALSGPEGPAAGPKGLQRAQRAHTQARRACEGERSETVVPEAVD